MGTASAASKQPETGEGHKKKTFSLSALKGAPLSVLIALWRYGPQDRKALAERTGWGKDAVGDALHLLVEIGLASRRHYRAWEVAEGLDLLRLLGNPGGGGQGERRRSRPSAQAERRERRQNRSWAAGGGPETAAPVGERGRERALSTRGVDNERRHHRSSPPAERRRHPPSRRESGLPRSPAPERRSERASPYDVVGVDHVRSDHPVDPKYNNIIQRLHALQPPFSGAEAWLQTVPLDQVEGWLAYLEAMADEARDGIRNESAFLRKQVMLGMRPPLSARRQRRVCPSCGRGHFDEQGRCLVCYGNVRV